LFCNAYFNKLKSHLFAMRLEPLLTSDLDQLVALQPPDWNDIIPSQRSFIESSFCHPFKLVERGSLLGIGTYAKFGTSVWLAQIIVHPLARSRGIGYMITKALLQCKDVVEATSVQLIATDLGLPLYQKCGFRTESSYWFYRGGKITFPATGAVAVNDATIEQQNKILEMDLLQTGEDRSRLLSPYLPFAKITEEQGELTGYYLSGLKEGLIVAKNVTAGFALMAEKSKSSDTFVVPEQNTSAIKLLEDSEDGDMVLECLKGIR
jgi:GNAT superfamily N-acetyltransferase